jgi:CheY-like chemotaxis protein/two-component sensor histidine kinase
VSHELRTPLSPILAWTHVLREPSTGAEQLRRGLEAIERNARLEAHIIDDLLEVSRIRAGTLRLERALVDLRAVVAAATDTLAQEAAASRVRFETRVPPESVTVRGDAIRLQQVVWNLLANALKFSKPGGEVRLVLRAGNGDAVLAVSDDGAGIAPALLPGIFEPFRQGDSSRTRSVPGLGLGLAIAKRLVDLHDGSIAAESGGPGQGACFTVRLPLLGGGAEAAPRPTSRARRLPLCVLVVDDSADTLEGLRMLLEAEGHHVVGAPSGDAALALLDRETPDVLVSDVAMPAMDGYTLLSRARARRGLEQLAAVAITGYASDAEAETALAAGYDAFLPKPVDPARLADLLERVVSTRRAPESRPGTPSPGGGVRGRA